MSNLIYRKDQPDDPANIYGNRDPEDQGPHFMKHLDRMTVEKLHNKSAIAAELAHRDIEIDQLKTANAELVKALSDLIYYLDDVSSPLLYGNAVDTATAALTKHQIK